MEKDNDIYENKAVNFNFEKKVVDHQNRQNRQNHKPTDKDSIRNLETFHDILDLDLPRPRKRQKISKEIELLRETHSRTLEGTDGNAVDHIFLGKVGKDFAFSDLKAKVLTLLMSIVDPC